MGHSFGVSQKLYLGQIKSCNSFLSVVRRSKGNTHIAGWKDYIDRELAKRNPQNIYRNKFGSIFGAPDIVTSSIVLLVSKEPNITQILELEASSTMNTVYAASHSTMEKLTWECFASGTSVLDDYEDLSTSALALFNPLKSEEEYSDIVKNFREKNGRFLLLLSNESFQKTRLYRNWVFILGAHIHKKRILQNFEEEEPKELFFFTFDS